MKKTLIGLIFILSFLLSSCSFLFKTALSIKSPKVETNQNIVEYLQNTECKIEKTFVVNCPTDSLLIYKNLMKGFTNEILIYKDSLRYCYQGKSKCTSEKLKKTIDEFHEFYVPCNDDTIDFKELLFQLKPLLSENDNLMLKNDKIYFFAYWSIFYGSKKNKKEYFYWLNEYCNKYPDKFEIVLINVDLNSNWGLQEGKKLKLKFKMNKKNSVDLHFGNMPYKK